MTPERQAVLLDRAIILIMSEWGQSREQVTAWLNDDLYEWSEAVRPEVEYGPDNPSPFMQVTRESKVDMPSRFFTGLYVRYKPTGEIVMLAEHMNVGDGWMCRGHRGIFTAKPEELEHIPAQ
jgi:hypothetical protein